MPQTLDDIKKAVELLEQQHLPEIEVKVCPLMKGLQYVVKYNNVIYYPPDLKSGELKAIDLDTKLTDK
jgi:hypothetical protein